MKKILIFAAAIITMIAAAITVKAQETSIMAGTVQVTYTGRFNAYANGYKPIDTVTYDFTYKSLREGFVESGSHNYPPKVGIGLVLYKVTELMGFTALVDKKGNFCIYVEDGAVTLTWMNDNHFRIDYIPTNSLSAYNKLKREQIVITSESYVGK